MTYLKTLEDLPFPEQYYEYQNKRIVRQEAMRWIIAVLEEKIRVNESDLDEQIVFPELEKDLSEEYCKGLDHGLIQGLMLFLDIKWIDIANEMSRD